MGTFRLTVVLASGVAAMTIAVACTGSDPAPVNPEPSAGSSGTNTSSGSSGSSGAPIDGGSYGVFLTREKFKTDFRSGEGDAGDRFAFVDGKCKGAAEAANLDHPERYRAMITMYAGSEGNDLERLGRFATQGQKRGAHWCAITTDNASAPHVDCADGNVIFATSEDLSVGPLHALFRNELGEPQLPVTFFSGFYVSDAGVPTTRNCAGWTTRFPTLATGEAPPPDAGAAAGFGLGMGDAVPRTSTPVVYQWIGNRPTYCEERWELSLLCLEVPD